MNTALIIIAVVLVAIGLLGSVVPGLAGPPFSWLGLLSLNFTTAADYTPAFLISTALVCVAITVLDYVIPSLSTKKHGGSKAGIWGCNIGLVISIIGLPFGPQDIIGVVFWPFFGAFVGELLGGKESRQALRAAWGAFLGFLCGTGLKLAYAIVCAFFVVRDLIV